MSSGWSWGVLGRGSISSSTARPLSVMRHPPFTRSTSRCEKRSSSGARAPILLVRAAQSGPLVAKIVMSRLRSGMDANPSG